jgi:pre-mRNA-processing factor 17
LDPPSHLKPDPDHVCYIPKKLLHTWAGHSKGVSAIKFFPQYGHFILSASMDSTVKIWEVYGKRRCMQTYNAHKLAVRDVDFSSDGRKFVSVAFDKYCRMFDTETGKCIANITSGKTPVCVKMYPLDDNQFVVGQKNKIAVQWDIRSAELVQEYDRHLDQINTVTFIDQARRFVTTSDDKSVRVWDYGVGVDIKYIADPAMHAIPAAVLSPDGEFLLGQSMDNKIVTFLAGDGERFKMNNKKTFKGHNVSGYACRVDMSPDGRYVVSGTAEGGMVFWDWKTSRVFKRLKAHNAVTIGVAWHPIEGSKVASCSWDGTIKFWD